MTDHENQKLDNQNEEILELDDERRVKVLSPTALVIRRFLRNKLAIVGMVILIAMILFSFVGTWISPYSETQVFRDYNYIQKNYAGASKNTDYRFTEADNMELPSSAQSKFILAVNNEEPIFTTDDVSYYVEAIGDSSYMISQLQKVADANFRAGRFGYTDVGGAEVSEVLKAAFEAAIEKEENNFTLDNVIYTFSREDTTYTIYTGVEAAIASYWVYDLESADEKISYDFRYAAEVALASGEPDFEVDKEQYTLVEEQENLYLIYKGDQVIANISDMNITPSSSDVFLTLNYKNTLRKAIAEGAAEFTYPNDKGEEVIYTLALKNGQYTIQSETYSLLIKDYERPSSAHLLGTDANGMDLLTRLMYGGQISLLIGFIVITISGVIGIVLGGIAGYFGKWPDMLLMRLVDIFNCIPSLPIMIILGAVMDSLRVDVKLRIFYLMLLMGILSWPEIARLIRGQILSLREQEFMVATEATGISIRHRIFRHLVPNVIPQLIVKLTLGLGDAILMESTLSFLGLGVKHPYASWGNIVNAVNSIHVMTKYWYAWIPAGLCILITVLGFNFVGDGLRDAFDPKMKR